jgi:hypothetical protein
MGALTGVGGTKSISGARDGGAGIVIEACTVGNIGTLGNCRAGELPKNAGGCACAISKLGIEGAAASAGILEAAITEGGMSVN